MRQTSPGRIGKISRLRRPAVGGLTTRRVKRHVAFGGPTGGLLGDDLRGVDPPEVDGELGGAGDGEVREHAADQA